MADKFEVIEAELYKIRSSFEPQMTEAEVRAAFSFLQRGAPDGDRQPMTHDEARRITANAGVSWAATHN